jgi:hypothetical protein
MRQPNRNRAAASIQFRWAALEIHLGMGLFFGFSAHRRFAFK